MEAIGQVQLGKNGLTNGFFELLANQFKNHKNVKVTILRSCCRDKAELREIEKKILEGLGKNYSSRSIGYTLAIKRHRKDIR